MTLDFEKTIDRLLSKYVTERIEKLFAVLSLAAFAFHLLGIFLHQQGWMSIPALDEKGYLSAISTPFTVILIYEVIQLAMSFRKPLIDLVIYQLQIVSLIYIRNVFKIFADLEGSLNGNAESFITEILFALLASGILFAVVIFVGKLVRKSDLQVEERPLLVSAKRYLAVTLIVGTILALGTYLLGFSWDDLTYYVAEGFSLVPFFEAVFSLMIVMDVVVFILSFLANTDYRKLFTDAAYILAAILLRLSITTKHPLDLLLVVVSCLVIVLVTVAYQKYCLSTKK